MRKSKKNENVAVLAAQVLAKKAEVLYLRGRVYAQENPKKVKAGVLAGLGAAVLGIAAEVA